MAYLLSLFTVIAALISVAYLQLPTFLLPLGYRWFHRYRLKRWVCRGISLVCFLLFLFLHPPAWLIAVTGSCLAMLLIFSLVNANPRIYVALNESQIIKLKHAPYQPETEVLGYLDESGFAICYPLQEMIKPRHLLNDVFNGNPLCVSYCMACRSAMVYSPMVSGMRLKFEVLGVYRRNMVMGDTLTGSIWQQGTGEAMYGSLKNERLSLLPYQQTTLKDWLQQFPDSLVAIESEDVKDGIFTKERLMEMMKVTETLVAPGKTNLRGLPLRELIFGIEIDDLSKAYPVSELKRQNHFADKLGDNELRIEYNPATNFIKILNVTTNRILSAQSHWWFGWKEFHANTEVWKSSKDLDGV